MRNTFDDLETPDLPTAPTASAKPTTPVFTFRGKPVDQSVTEAAIKAGSPIPQRVSVQRYLDLLDEAEQVKADVEACEQELKAAGLTEIIAFNCAAEHRSNPVSSIQLVDAPSGVEIGPETPAVRFTAVNRYSPKQDAVVEWVKGAAERGVKIKTSDVLAWEIVTAFDSSVLLEGGKYSPERFAAFQAALNTVCEQYGVQNPLTVDKKLIVDGEFHQKRWSLLSPVENTKLAAVLPCTTQLSAVRPKRAKVAKRSAGTAVTAKKAAK